MKEPTNKMIAYASDIHVYSPNDFTDEIRASFELTRKYIQENKRFLKRKKLFAPTQKSTLAMMFPTRVLVMWVLMFAWVLYIIFTSLADPKTDWSAVFGAIMLFVGPAVFYNVVTYRLESSSIVRMINELDQRPVTHLSQPQIITVGDQKYYVQNGIMIPIE